MIEGQFERFEGLEAEALLVFTVVLAFKPSTTPLGNAFLARNQLRISSRCPRSVLAIFFIGSIRERIPRVHQRSRSRPAQKAVEYPQNNWNSSFRR